MRFTYKWLQQYVALKEPAAEIADLLTRQGLEVVSCFAAGPGLPGVVTGRVVTADPHGTASGLVVCRVQIGNGERVILCGAPNVRPGLAVAAALPGARLPDGKQIEAATLYGVLSEGMLCSEYELGISEDHEGIMVLPADTPIGQPLDQALDLTDHVIEVEVTPNRPDCLCVLGIAREIAAKKGRSLRLPETAVREEDESIEKVSSVQILAPEACPRYVARVLTGLKVAPSPFWLRRRLTLAGVRPISNIVDVTNLVMLELGQPLHAFDLDLLAEKRIVVRHAHQGERMTTLDGVERIFCREDLLICDGLRPVAVAGVMGGLDSEIRPETARVLLESAFFEPRGIRRTAKRLGLSSEASYRFEREIDREGTRRAADRASRLMLELGGGRLAKGALDVYPRPLQRRNIPLKASRVDSLIGTRIPADEIQRLLQGLEIELKAVNGDSWMATPPSFRPDLRLSEDLVEEVARLHGYDTIATELPRAPVSVVRLDAERRAEEKARDVLVGMGFNEVINYSFVGREALGHLGCAAPGAAAPVALENPLSEAQAVLRTTLVGSLLETVSRNERRKNCDLRLFELRKVFLPTADSRLPEEKKRLAGAIMGKRSPPHWDRAPERADLFDLKGILGELFSAFDLEEVSWSPKSKNSYLHPGLSGDISINTVRIGSFGKLHPDVREFFNIEEEVFVFELDFACFASSMDRTRRVQPIIRTPAVERDIALILDEEVACGRVLERIRELADARVVRIELFDLYRGAQVPEGKKSMAFRVTYQDPARTLTDEEVNRVQESLLKELLPSFQAQLR